MSESPRLPVRSRLIAMPRDKATLLDGLKDPDSPLYLEDLLEKHLGIADEPVAGEYI